jgi:hypothetical protein
MVKSFWDDVKQWAKAPYSDNMNAALGIVSRLYALRHLSLVAGYPLNSGLGN